MRTPLIALAAWLGLGWGSDARADIDLNFGGGDVAFTRNATDTGASVTFSGFTISNAAGSQSDNDSAGFSGKLTGSYSYSSAGLSGPYQSAALSGNGQNQVKITDKAAQTLTADVLGSTITTYYTGDGGTSAGITGTITLGTVDYNGSSSDLLALKNDANITGGSMVISFGFTGSESLSELASSASDPTSFSGTISASASYGAQGIAPEPSSLALAGLGSLGLIGFGLWRKRGMR